MKIDSYEKILTMYLKQKANLDTYKSQVEATAADITAVSQAADNLLYIKNYAELVDTAKRSVFKIKNDLVYGDNDEPIAEFGGFPDFSPPFPLEAGLLEEGLKRNRRFKAANGYTKAIGIELGIEEESADISPDDAKPTAEFTAASAEFMFAVVVSNRAKADSWDVLFQRDGETGWTLAKTATGKSVDVTITPTNPAKPERIKVKIQLKKNNQNYGQASAITEITLNP